MTTTPDTFAAALKRLAPLLSDTHKRAFVRACREEADRRADWKHGWDRHDRTDDTFGFWSDVNRSGLWDMRFLMDLAFRHAALLDVAGPEAACPNCNGTRVVTWDAEDGGSPPLECPICHGTGRVLRTPTLCGQLWAGIAGSPPPFDRCWRHVSKQGCPRCTAILRWNGGTVPRIARAVRDERAWGDLPVLADALEDAGVTDAAILAHCRGDGCEAACDHHELIEDALKDDPYGSFEVYTSECEVCKGTGKYRVPAIHVAGCWVLELILGGEE